MEKYNVQAVHVTTTFGMKIEEFNKFFKLDKIDHEEFYKREMQLFNDTMTSVSIVGLEK